MEITQQGPKKRIAMLASGSGTNVENFIRYFKDHPIIEISLVISNNQQAKVLERAAQAGVPWEYITREEWKSGQLPLKVIKKYNIDMIVLAGFLQLIPSALIESFPDRIINIHPALLPGFGGKGMYGMRVHEAVIEAGESYSGISIHLVNERYDEGKILFQERVELSPGETPESLAVKIHSLEYRHFPNVVEQYFMEMGH